MLKSKKNSCIAGLILSGIMLLLTSCITAKEIEYRFVVPEIDFPEFPVWEKEEEIVDFENRTVTIPIDVYIELAEYKADITATEEMYGKLRVLANEF